MEYKEYIASLSGQRVRVCGGKHHVYVGTLVSFDDLMNVYLSGAEMFRDEKLVDKSSHLFVRSNKVRYIEPLGE